MEIEGKHEDWLLDIMATYGHSKVIEYVNDDHLTKQELLQRHLAELAE